MNEDIGWQTLMLIGKKFNLKCCGESKEESSSLQSVLYMKSVGSAWWFYSHGGCLENWPSARVIVEYTVHVFKSYWPWTWHRQIINNRTLIWSVPGTLKCLVSILLMNKRMPIQSPNMGIGHRAIWNRRQTVKSRTI